MLTVCLGLLFQISGRLKQIYVKNFPVIFHYPYHHLQILLVSQSLVIKPSPLHGTVTTELKCEDGVFSVMRGVIFLPEMVLTLIAKMFNFSLT